jgi:biotin synthase
VLSNAKSGRCSEDCGFCSQSARFETGVAEYPLLSDDDLFDQARRANDAKAEKFCIVTATRGPNDRLLDSLCPSVTRIKDAFPHLKICTSLGLLTRGAAERLRTAGVDRYNHNLETSRGFFPNVVSTHSWDDRVDTVRIAKEHGMEACCGGIVGMGESDGDIVDLLFSLRELEVDSIPLNLFNPRPGTPFGEAAPLSAMKALRVLAIARLVNPSRDIRCAGGREAVLGPLQPLALFAVNSIFANGYLTTTGQGLEADERMIRELGYEVFREEE